MTVAHTDLPRRILLVIVTKYCVRERVLFIGSVAAAGVVVVAGAAVVGVAYHAGQSFLISATRSPDVVLYPGSTWLNSIHTAGVHGLSPGVLLCCVL